MKRLLQPLIGLLLLPLLGGAAVALFSLLVHLDFGWAVHPLLVAGFGAYLVIHALFHRPILTYVFAHELSHAFWSLIFGGRLRELHVGEGGGHATVTRSNLAVVLAPYFFPFYAFVFLGFYGLAVWLGVGAKVYAAVALLVGMSLAFHYVFTGHALSKKQSDLGYGGLMLSLVLVGILNAAALLLVLKALAPARVDLAATLADAWRTAGGLVGVILRATGWG